MELTKSIINNLNLIFKTKDINHLNKPTYQFLNLLSGFIAHYDINGFKHYYQDLRILINDLKNSDGFDLKEIRLLIEHYENDITLYFNNIEYKEDFENIKRLMVKNNISLIDLSKKEIKEKND